MSITGPAQLKLLGSKSQIPLIQHFLAPSILRSHRRVEAKSDDIAVKGNVGLSPKTPVDTNKPQEQAIRTVLVVGPQMVNSKVKGQSSKTVQLP